MSRNCLLRVPAECGAGATRCEGAKEMSTWSDESSMHALDRERTVKTAVGGERVARSSRNVSCGVGLSGVSEEVEL
jgi:hypothetical protein